MLYKVNNVSSLQLAVIDSRLRDNLKHIKEINPDIFCFQEVHIGCPDPDQATIRNISEHIEKLGYFVKFSQPKVTHWVNVVTLWANVVTLWVNVVTLWASVGSA